MEPSTITDTMTEQELSLQAAFDRKFSGVARFFSPVELRFRGQSNEPGEIAAGLNTLPPKELWDNIVPTLHMADQLRALFGAPLRVLSVYRSPAYNARIGGEKHSYHMRFMAMDLAPVRGTLITEARRLYGCAMTLRRVGVHIGGIGRYPWGVHIDCGPEREW